MKDSPKVALMMADGTEECEALIVLDLLHRSGIECDLISVQQKTAIVSSHEVVVICDATVRETNLDDYDAIVLPGGMPGMENLYKSSDLIEAIHSFADDEKLLAAICASPTILAREDLLENVHATAYPSFQKYLVDDGAILEPRKCVVQDGSIITSRGLGCAFEFAYAIIKYLVPSTNIEELKEQIIYSWEPSSK